MKRILMIVGVINGLTGFAYGAQQLADGEHKKVAAVRTYSAEQQKKLEALNLELIKAGMLQHMDDEDKDWKRRKALIKVGIEQDKLHPDDITMGPISMLELAVANSDEPDTRYLLERGANPNQLDCNESPLLFQVKTAPIARLLLAHKADVQCKNDFGRTLLHCQTQDPRLVYVYWQAGVDVGKLDTQGLSPLLATCTILCDHSPSWAAHLVKIGASLDNCCPESYALYKGLDYKGVIKKLKRRGDEVPGHLKSCEKLSKAIDAARKELEALPARGEQMKAALESHSLIPVPQLRNLIVYLANVVPISVDQALDELDVQPSVKASDSNNGKA